MPLSAYLPIMNDSSLACRSPRIRSPDRLRIHLKVLDTFFGLEVSVVSSFAAKIQ